MARQRLLLKREVQGSVILVEPGAESQASSVLEIHRRVLTEGDFFITEADEFRKTRAWKAAAIRELVASANSCFLVARLDGELVGALMAQGGHLRRSRHVARVEIFVDQPVRGRGVGRLLMDGVVAWARENPDVEKLALSVFADNRRAISLYESMGFVQEGRRVQEYRLGDGSYRDDLLMSLWLGAS